MVEPAMNQGRGLSLAGATEERHLFGRGDQGAAPAGKSLGDDGDATVVLSHHGRWLSQ